MKMINFPAFMLNPENRITQESQYTDSIDGYVFNGTDGNHKELLNSIAEIGQIAG